MGRVWLGEQHYEAVVTYQREDNLCKKQVRHRGWWRMLSETSR